MNELGGALKGMVCRQGRPSLEAFFGPRDPQGIHKAIWDEIPAGSDLLGDFEPSDLGGKCVGMFGLCLLAIQFR